MRVGGGGDPARNLIRHEVHRPRPPQVAVTSTPEACAAFRMVVPGATWRACRSGKIVSDGLIRGPQYHFALDFPAAIADSDGTGRHRRPRPGASQAAAGSSREGSAPLRRLSPPLAGSYAPR